MASYSLPHNMSLQQLTELQEAAAAAAASSCSRFGDNRSAMDHSLPPPPPPPPPPPAPPQQVQHLLSKKSRGEQQQQGENKTVDDEEEEEEEEARDGEGEIHEGDESKVFEGRMNSSLGGTGPNSHGIKQHVPQMDQSEQQQQQQDHSPVAASGPTWLSEAMLRQAAAAAAAASQASPNYSQWLTMPQPQPQQQQQSGDLADVESGRGAEQSSTLNNNDHSQQLNVKGFLELHAADTGNSTGDEQQRQQRGGGEEVEEGMDSKMWNARYKADLVTHPLYEQLLSAHISCLRTATPVDQLPKIDAQLAHSSQVAAKYSMLVDPGAFSKDKDEVNEFMAHYVTLLRSFKEQLQQHVRVHAMEAVVACWELEQSLFTLTGVSPGEGTGATMSEDEEEQADCDSGYYDTGMDGHDYTGFGPLIPTETERTLMERVRHELKIELKQGYKAKINDVREEILRKRRAGKLPGDTTSVLKSWWHAHSKWPYPSEDDKARLVQETGLELKQINNWFINQRKRNWHSNPSSSTSLKNKRKR